MMVEIFFEIVFFQVFFEGENHQHDDCTFLTQKLFAKNSLLDHGIKSFFAALKAGNPSFSHLGFLFIMTYSVQGSTVS